MNTNDRYYSGGFVIYEAIFALLVVVIVIAAGFFILHDTNSSTSSKTSSTKDVKQTTPSPYATLSPATVPSKVTECTTPISFQSDGNSGPIQCANGDLNVTEWNALSALEPSVMSLGYSPTASQVQSDLCSDANASDSDANTKNSYAVEQTIYQISALYYGWTFPSSIDSMLSSGSC